MKSFTNYARLGNNSTSITPALTSNKKYLEPNNDVYSMPYTYMYSYPGQYSDFVTYTDEQNKYLEGDKIPVPNDEYKSKMSVPPVIDINDSPGKSCKSCNK